MKYQIIITLIFTFVCISSCLKISLRKEQKVLPSTPKGQDLQNNYGLPPNNKKFGGNLLNENKIAGNTQMTILKPDGKIEEISVNNTVINKVQYNQCLINQDPHYKICQQLNDCDLCSNSDVCGWCASTSQCLPGNIGDAKCPGDCLSHWLFEKGTCTGKVKSGSIGNVAPESTKLITPEYSQPKVKVNSITTEHTTVNQQVQVGVQNINQVIKVQDQNGKLVTKSNVKAVPIMGNLQKQIPTSMNTQTATYSLVDGKKLDIDIDDEKNKKKFGEEKK